MSVSETIFTLNLSFMLDSILAYFNTRISPRNGKPPLPAPRRGRYEAVFPCQDLEERGALLPDRLPVGLVCMECLAVHGLSAPQTSGPVKHVANGPGDSRHKDRHQPPRRASEEDHDEGADEQRPIADVQQTVVVQLGRRQDCTLRVDLLVQLPRREADGSNRRADHHDHGPHHGGVPTRAGREHDRVGDQTTAEQSEEQVTGEEPQELEPRVQRDLAVLEDPPDQDEQARRESPAEHRDECEERPRVLLDSTGLQRKENPIHSHHQLSMTRGD